MIPPPAFDIIAARRILHECRVRARDDIKIHFRTACRPGRFGASAAVRSDVVVPEALAENINCINHVNMSEWKYWYVYAFQTVI